MDQKGKNLGSVLCIVFSAKIKNSLPSYLISRPRPLLTVQAIVWSGIMLYKKHFPLSLFGQEKTVFTYDRAEDIGRLDFQSQQGFPGRKRSMRERQ